MADWAWWVLSGVWGVAIVALAQRQTYRAGISRGRSEVLDELQEQARLRAYSLLRIEYAQQQPKEKWN